jgi:hypothetical protein
MVSVAAYEFHPYKVEGKVTFAANCNKRRYKMAAKQNGRKDVPKKFVALSLIVFQNYIIIVARSPPPVSKHQDGIGSVLPDLLSFVFQKSSTSRGRYYVTQCLGRPAIAVC